MDKKKQIWKEENAHLAYSREIIKKNIERYEAEAAKLKVETKELYDNYRSNNPELHNDLVIALDMQNQTVRSLQKNERAYKRPYFGRIDYEELLSDGSERQEEERFSLYLGKSGVMRTVSEVLVVDWRAPVSSVYYDSDIGKSSYLSPDGSSIQIELQLKRTFEIEGERLIDFYDTDVITNDEFLTKYLAKNKEVVMGEIIATIQKEQNEIIRDTPWHNIVVQGVAGSGKTTVAMHRISYILYNYKEKFRSDEFYIIGSNKMLLNYITGVLPNLDVYFINQMTLTEFVCSFLDKDYTGGISQGRRPKKEDGRVSSSAARKLQQFKGSLSFAKALECFLLQYEERTVPMRLVTFHGKEVYTAEEIRDSLRTFSNISLQERIDMLGKRLANKVRNILEMEDAEPEQVRSELKKFKDHFGKKGGKVKLEPIYEDFLVDMLENGEEYEEAGVKLPGGEVLSLLLMEFRSKKVDLYDLVMLLYVKKRIIWCGDFAFVRHIVVDEAQDFGVSAFYVLNRLFPDCTFTVMGDVSQNIYYDTGMNDWEDLRTGVFTGEKDRFYVLAKSYRNTVEISDYASAVLRRCSFTTYDIEPVIRHGNPVTVKKVEGEKELAARAAEYIRKMQSEGYDTIAVICRNPKEAEAARHLLGGLVDIAGSYENLEEMTFANGVMVLPIHLTKGLEFDGVILWNPSEENYPTLDREEKDGAAKLLYVAITRALHELFILYRDNLTGLLKIEAE